MFSFALGWFPPAGADSMSALVMPAMTLGIVSAGMISRLIRSSMIEVLAEDYIRAARAKGIGRRLVLWRHGLKNAMIPVITMLGLQFGAMLAGAVVTEIVFSRPGIGRLVVTAILQKDYPLVQGCVVFLASVYLLVQPGGGYRLCVARSAHSLWHLASQAACCATRGPCLAAGCWQPGCSWRCLPLGCAA